MIWTKDENNNSRPKIYIGAINDYVYGNPNSSHLFQEIKNIKKLDLNNYDTSMITNMEKMFW
jgi:bacterial surface protein 26-residue repeat